MSSLTKQLEARLTEWPNVTAMPHRFAGREYLFGKAEIGHVHFWGDVDIPFTRAIHDVLLADQAAERHRWLPNSGWVTFHMKDAGDLDHALWLMRISWLRYALKSSPEAAFMLREESARMCLSEKLTELVRQFAPAPRLQTAKVAVFETR